jgi:hypothetical protein
MASDWRPKPGPPSLWCVGAPVGASPSSFGLAGSLGSLNTRPPKGFGEGVRPAPASFGSEGPWLLFALSCGRTVGDRSPFGGNNAYAPHKAVISVAIAVIRPAVELINSREEPPSVLLLPLPESFSIPWPEICKRIIST